MNLWFFLFQVRWPWQGSTPQWMDAPPQRRPKGPRVAARGSRLRGRDVQKRDWQSRGFQLEAKHVQTTTTFQEAFRGSLQRRQQWVPHRRQVVSSWRQCFFVKKTTSQAASCGQEHARVSKQHGHSGPRQWHQTVVNSCYETRIVPS